MDDEAAGVSQDALLDGRVRLLQPKGGHRAGTDAVLLAAACRPVPGDKVSDLGAATGAVGLMVAARMPDCRVIFIERDATLADLCRRNLILNGVVGRAEVLEADLLAATAERRAAGLRPGFCDIVATNPPFLDARRARPSPRADRASAHHMSEGGLAAWLASAADLLRPGGRLVMIHRADRLKACLDALAGFGGVAVLPIFGQRDKAAIRVLIAAVKGSGAPGGIRPPLVLHEADGRFTTEAAALHSGEAALGWT